MKTYNVLELWEETIQRTGVLALIGFFTENDLPSPENEYEDEFYSIKRTLFIFLSHSSIATRIWSSAQRPQQLDLLDFVTDKITYNGTSYIAYYHKDYIIEAAARKGELYEYTKSFPEHLIFESFVIDFRKWNWNLNGKPRKGENSDVGIYLSLECIKVFIKKELSQNYKKLKSTKDGFASIKVVFLDQEDSVPMISDFSSCGFSINEIEEIFNKIYESIQAA